MIGVINFGLGNLGSIINSFKEINANIKIISDPKDIDNIEHLILPGVGSFRLGMKNLLNKGWDKKIFSHVEKQKPLLGICLGMQLLFNRGEEDGECKGLGLIKGKVIKMKSMKNRKLPHVGWNQLNFKNKHPIFEKVRDNVDYYFVHSYECLVENNSNIISTSNYHTEILSCVSNGNNIVGTQFHPEKSPPNGLKILKNFLNWNGKC
jgi:glutamine amidotransferase|tara:strand:+ start:863 stop:1483 length:621 start_codon:yes stop_codon:yes gene_type:complete